MSNTNTSEPCIPNSGEAYMTLRDHFAIQVLQKLMGKDYRFAVKAISKEHENDAAHDIAKEILSETAYQWADAMLEAR